jgi:hypothetical protein
MVSNNLPSNLPVAVQLYSLRMLPDSLDVVLGHVADAGYGLSRCGNHWRPRYECQ